ncbi:hypothetical protein [Pedobacter xixiisoli]|uniref:Lipoprotein n=1 Tax=Pedobacter xixiisoli TaxID=1476464 RepID=A0A285ZNV6_9SPHI|nr:hypothetical protein [Pedobacter xixiisoli]SOD11324.1 hypothetical protein SAMN06297358_0092 [Pedobacter xixiisoli]
MKRTKVVLFISLCAVIFSSCKKGNENEEVVEAIKKEELKRKINEIIPKQYQDTLTKLGISLNLDATPPNMEGAFAIKPLKLLKSNRPEDPASLTFTDVTVKFLSQDSDNNIKLIGRKFLTDADTSIVTAISGKGNDFTIYGKVKSVSGTNSAIFGIIISGTKDGAVLRNVRYGLINIDNKNGGTRFIRQGEARAVFDTDLISENIQMF